MQVRCENGGLCCGVGSIPRFTLIQTGRCPVPEIPEGDYKGQQCRDPQEPSHFHDSMEE